MEIAWWDRRTWRNGSALIAGGTALAAAVSLAGLAIPAAVGASAAGPAVATLPATPAANPAATTPTVANPAPCISRAEIAAWPLRDRAANLVMIGGPIAQIADAIALVRTEGLGGILVRGTPKQTDGPALRTLRDAGRHGRTFVAVDEEGGRVQHLRTAIGVLPSARSTPKTRTAAQLRAVAAKHGRGMAALGFTMNLAPDVDVEPLPPSGVAGRPSVGGRNGIGDRSYSASPAVVAEYGRAFALGMLDAGIVPVLKHFPGHGSATGDSHNIGALTPPLTVMRARDLIPFAEILRDPRIGVMTAHLYTPGLDEYPASLSLRAITQLLRGELGHRGLVITDSLSMWPIRSYYPAPQAAVLALRAGNDVLLFDDRPSVGAVLDALVAAMTNDEKLANQAVDANLRVMAAKGRAICEGPSVTPSTIVADTTVGAPPTTSTGGQGLPSSSPAAVRE